MITPDDIPPPSTTTPQPPPPPPSHAQAPAEGASEAAGGAATVSSGRGRLIAVGAGSLIALGVIGFVIVRALTPNPFEKAVEECGLEDVPFAATVADGGDTLILDHKGEDDLLGLDYEQFACALQELDVSSSVVSQMDNTRALDGRQSASWGGYEITWSYHPDSGLEAIIER